MEKHKKILISRYIKGIIAIMLFAGVCVSAYSASIRPTAQEDKEEYGLDGYEGVTGGIMSTPKDRKILSILATAQKLEAEGRLNDIFRKMGEQQIGFKDLIAFKGDYINDLASEYRKTGKGGVEADDLARAEWNKKYQHIERCMIQTRKDMVNRVWQGAVTEYMNTYPDSIVIKGDIGSWPTEAFDKMSFESDIDFTLFMLQVEHAEELRDMFENKIKEHFKMDMAQFDAFCTAQYKAALDVYIGPWGAKWGEIDMVKRGKAEVWFRDTNGELKSKKVPAEDILTMFHIMKGTHDDDTFKPTADMEPGISLELYRHVQHEIIGGKFTTIDKIIKMCKYFDRSIRDHAAMLNITDAQSTRLGVYASRVMEAKSQLEDKGALAKRVIELTNGFVGPNWANNPEVSLDQIASRGSHEMRKNISEGIKYHKDRINEISDPDEKAESRKWLEDVLEKEKNAFDHDGVKFPDDALKTLERYRGIREAKSYFGDKAADYVKFISQKADGARLAMGYLLEKADNNVDRVNYFLDYLDNNTIEHLRNSDIGIKVTDGDRVLYDVSIGSINERLNNSILGKIGNNTAFKTFNLAEEGYAYYEAYASAKTAEEAWKNIATELFRRRVPGGGLAEAVIMENYTRAGLETVYLIFPPAGIPEAVLSLGYQIGSVGLAYGQGVYWQSSLTELEDVLYEESTFKAVKGSNGTKWKLVRLVYKGKEYDLSDLKSFIKTRNDDGWWFHGYIGQVFSKAVENDPVLVQLRKIMDDETGVMGQTYKFKLMNIYDERNDAVREEFLKELIAKLEDRWAAFMLGQGVGAKKLEEVREGLNCGINPLVPETDNAEVDGELYRQALVDYDEHIKAIDSIESIKKKTGVELKYVKPVCSLDSLREAKEWNVWAAGVYEDMVEEIIKEIKEIKGSFSWADESDKKDMAFLLGYRKLAETGMSEESSYWAETYKEKVAELRKRYTAFVNDIVILPEEDIYEGEEVRFEVKMDLAEKQDAVYKWDIGGVEYEGLSYDGDLKGKLSPVNDGTLEIKFTVTRGEKIIGERKETVDILPVLMEGLEIEIPSGRTCLDEDNGSLQLKAISEYSDDTEADVTEYAVWEILSGDNAKIDGKGMVSLTEAESYTPTGEEKIVVRATYEEVEAEVTIALKFSLKDLGSYWETDPKYPEIPADSDPRGVLVTFKAITDDPDNNHKRNFKWLFTKSEGEEEIEGAEVEVFYSEMGQYGVLLTVTDEWGNIDEEHDTICIEEEVVEEEVVGEEDIEEEEEEQLFQTPTGEKNMYRSKFPAGDKELLVKRYDWETPLNKKASFVESAFWTYSNVGYFNGSTCLKTGPIAPGTVFNPGYLIYYDSNAKGIKYAVLGTGQETSISSVFVKEKKDYSHSGIISESVDNICPESIKITDVLSRSFRVSWLTKDGKEHTAIVWKYDDHGGYTYEGTKAVEPEDLLVKELAAELSEMYGGERDIWLKDKELISMVKEELDRVSGKERSSLASVMAPAKVNKEQIKKSVASRIEKGEKADLLFVKTEGDLKQAKSLTVEGAMDDVYTYKPLYVSTRPVTGEQVGLFCVKKQIPLVFGPYRIVGKKYGDITNHSNSEKLVDVWEIGLLHGKRHAYNEQGKIYFEAVYDMGKVQGPFKIFNRFGWERGNYLNDKKEGPVVIYNSFNGGQAIGKGFYRNDKREGQWVINLPGRVMIQTYKNNICVDYGPNATTDDWLEDVGVVDLL